MFDLLVLPFRFWARLRVPLAPVVPFPRSVPHGDAVVDIATDYGANSRGRPTSERRDFFILALEMMWFWYTFRCEQLCDPLVSPSRGEQREDAYNDRRFDRIDHPVGVGAERIAVPVGAVNTGRFA